MTVQAGPGEKRYDGNKGLEVYIPGNKIFIARRARKGRFFPIFFLWPIFVA